MLDFFRDRFTTMQLRARYERVMQQRLLELTESSRPQRVHEESGEWTLLGHSKGEFPSEIRTSIVEKVRKAVRENPYACNILRLLEAYVTGPGMKLNHQPDEDQTGDPETIRLVKTADDLWETFLLENARHYSFREHARRTWRDGESFLRKYATDQWPPTVRFIDPERIVPSADDPDSQGIQTLPGDVEQPVAYLHSIGNQKIEAIPADEILHVRIGVDSNEKRGVSIFAPLLEPLSCYMKWVETEMLARKLQTSIVLWRKVQGSPQMAESMAGQSARGTPLDRERIAPGTILTTNFATDIQFLQPNTHFGDAVPLGRMLLLSIAAGAGLPEFMLTADASNANFASTMVAEGPAVKFFQSEQQRFASEFTRLWYWIMQDAVNAGLLPENFFSLIDVRWSFPQLVNRDRAKERIADVKLIQTGVLSRSEVARRDGVDPAVMRAELQLESPGTGEER